MLTGKFAGQSILELIVAVGIFAIVSTSIVPLVLSQRLDLVNAEQDNFATRYAEEGLEAARVLRDQSWDSVAIGQHGLVASGSNWQLAGTSDTRDGYTRSLSVTAVSANSKRVVSTVTWQGAPVRNRQISQTTILTNWQVTQIANYLEGDWRQPVTAGTADVSPSGNAGTELIVKNNLLYLSSSFASTAKTDLHIFDVTNPSAPVSRSSTDFGVGDLIGLALAGNYLYAVDGATSNQLLIIDVTNPSAPVLVRQITVAGVKGRSIAVDGTTHLYVGTENNASGAELFVYSLADPINPSQVGSFEVGDTVNALTIFDKKAYLATSKDAAELIVLNVATPTAPVQLGAYNAPGNSNALAAFVKDEFSIYLGRAVDSSQNEFVILDGSTPSAITLLGSFDVAASIYDIVTVNHLAFVGTDDTNNEFKVIDIANPASLARFDTTPLNFPQQITGLAYQNNTIYVSVRSNDALRIIRSTP